MMIGKERSGLFFFLESNNVYDNAYVNLVKISKAFGSLNVTNSSFLCHQRLGHMPFKRLRQLPSIKSEITDSCCISECSICPLAKQTRSLFSLSNSKAIENFSLLHLDLGGPYSHDTHDHKSFFSHYY